MHLKIFIYHFKIEFVSSLLYIKIAILLLNGHIAKIMWLFCFFTIFAEKVGYFRLLQFHQMAAPSTCLLATLPRAELLMCRDERNKDFTATWSFIFRCIRRGGFCFRRTQVLFVGLYEGKDFWTFAWIWVDPLLHKFFITDFKTDSQNLYQVSCKSNKIYTKFTPKSDFFGVNKFT